MSFLPAKEVGLRREEGVALGPRQMEKPQEEDSELGI